LIKCHLSRLMGERKLKIADLARQTGLHRNTITLLYDETASRVDLDAIDRLCGYFGVGVGDLFEQVAPLPEMSGTLDDSSSESTASRKR
jgi:putative transcriptional regulator